MDFVYFVLKSIKRAGLKLKLYSLNGLKKDCVGQEESDLIKAKLLTSEPCMICRYGSTELNAVLKYEASISKYNFWQKSIKYLRNDMYGFWLDEFSINMLKQSAGFFPAIKKNIIRYAQIMLKESKKIDILGLRMHVESFFKNTFMMRK